MSFYEKGSDEIREVFDYIIRTERLKYMEFENKVLQAQGEMLKRRAGYEQSDREYNRAKEDCDRARAQYEKVKGDMESLCRSILKKKEVGG